MSLEREKIKKLVRGETVGNIATAFCAAALIYFAACYSVGVSMQISALKTAALISGPALLLCGIAVAAFCNIKYGGELERTLKEYVRSVLLENAALLHPERDSLTFYVCVGENSAELKVNNFKEKVNFDFSAFKKLSAMRKSAVSAQICERLTVTFVKLAAERGAEYKSVFYVARTGAKDGKPVPVIENGKPEKRAYKIYLKNG